MTDHKPAEPAQLELDDRPNTHIYEASALTALEPTERSQISRRCDIIDQAIVASPGSVGKPWKVHLPVLWSAPGRHRCVDGSGAVQQTRSGVSPQSC